MRRKLAGLLLLALLTGSVLAKAETTIDLSYDRYAVSEKTAKVIVHDATINTVRAGIFGANTSYRGGGYGLYDEENRSFNEALVQRLRESGVTALRLPGGIEGDYFHWYETVGDAETRIPQIDCFSKDYPTFTRKNGEPYQVLFGPDEWIALCGMTNTALAVQLNAGNGTPQEAVDYIRYLLDSGVAIDDITVGNEGCMAEERVEGVSVTKTPEEYIDFYNAVWDLMGEDMRRELKERGVAFGCIGIPASHPLCKYPQWDEKVLTALNGRTDFIDVHVAYSPYYVAGNNNEQIIKCLLASAELVRRHLDLELRTIKRCAPDVKIAISEHGPLGASPYSSGMPGGMYLAAFFNMALAEERVVSADYLPLTNHPAANNLLGYSDELSETVVWDNVVSMVFRMYAEQIGREVLATDVSGAKTFSSPAVGLMAAVRNVSEGEAAVYFDRETGCGTMFILNRAYKENTVFDIALPFEHARLTAVTELFTPNNTMGNTRNRPTLVQPVVYEGMGGDVRDGRLTITTKPVSLVRLDFIVPAAP